MTDETHSGCLAVHCRSNKPANVIVWEATPEGGHESEICDECADVLGIAQESSAEDRATLPDDTDERLVAHYASS